MTVRVLDLKGLREVIPGLSPREIRKHLSEIPHFTSPGGGKLLFREDEILDWLEHYRVRTVDLGSAFEMARQITSAGLRKKSTRVKKEDAA